MSFAHENGRLKGRPLRVLVRCVKEDDQAIRPGWTTKGPRQISRHWFG